MNNYQPPYTITNDILSYVSSISEKIGRLSAVNTLNSMPHLRKKNRIRSIHSSLKIEANSLSFGQIKDVINGKMVLGRQEEIQEVKNAYEAYERLSQINPFNMKQLKEFHHIMTKYVTDESGDFRQGEEGVFNGGHCIFMAPPAKLVPRQMELLFQWMKESQGIVHPLILGSVFHYEFVLIHPFANGNGRMARLWHTAILTKWRPEFEYIPIESPIEEFQEDYYEAIAKCHADGSSTLFIEFMLSQIDQMLDSITVQIKDDSGLLTEYVRRLLDMMEYGVAYKANLLMEKLGMKSRESFRKNYLRPALDLNLIQMTIPDKPNSRNQRYIKL